MNRIAVGTLGMVMLVLMSIGATPALAQSFWGTFPDNANPRDMGKKVVTNLVNRAVIETRPYGVIYPESCVSYGSLRFAGAIKDKELLDQLIARYQGMLNTDGGTRAPRGPTPPAPGAATPQIPPATQPVAAARGQRGGRGGGTQGIAPKDGKAINMIPEADHVDRSVFGILPLELYRQTGNAAYLAIGKKSADDQWANPTSDGLTEQTRWWIDDMFMITSLQTQAYRATKDKVYLDRGAKQMAAYLDKLQKENGLFYHADDVPAFWGRGDGWVAAGLAELLSELPEDHPQRARIMEGYKKMMAGLLKYQAPDGMWRQLIDKSEAWPETSGSGMFTFAMAVGVKKGWLPAAEYKDPVKKAWIALCGFLDADGNVREVCMGTNKYPQMRTAPEGLVQYYLDRPRRAGDLHGQAAFIWAAWAMLD